MRSYDVVVAALAIGAPRKWTDNVLSQYDLPEVLSVRQGISRRIPYQGLIRLAVVRQLHTELGIGIGDAVGFAARLLDSGQHPVLAAGQLTLGVDLPALRRAVDEGLSAALESAPARPRGRPPRKSATRELRRPTAPPGHP